MKQQQQQQQSTKYKQLTTNISNRIPQKYNNKKKPQTKSKHTSKQAKQTQNKKTNKKAVKEKNKCLNAIHPCVLELGKREPANSTIKNMKNKQINK